MAILLLFIGLLSQISLTLSQPIVTVEQGKLMGKTVHFQNDFLAIDTDLDVFFGIPYAEPPVGERRFAAPLPKDPWADDEVYNATYFRDICVQFDETSLLTMSEDCLHLNVYTPRTMPSAGPQPVMVYIHGGGYSLGYGRYYSGISLAAVGDVIIVTINYRLSAFGYLTTGDEASPGNYGMLDQVEALRWIKTNIAAFGGDPNMITIFGESAGAGSVSAHLFSPLSRDLFDQAILESGSVLAPWSFHFDLDAQREIAFQIGAAVGCAASDTDELMACMRTVDASAINTASFQLGYLPEPCIDGTFLTESPMVSLENNNFKKCPLINGFNKDEGTLLILSSEVGYPDYWNSTEPPYVSKQTFDEELKKLLEGNGMYTNDLIEDSIKQEYIDWTKADDPEADYFDEFNNVGTDAFFSCSAILETRFHVMAAEHDVYQYFFTHVPSVSIYQTDLYDPKWLGASHAEELPFVFGWPFDPPNLFKFPSHDYPEEEMELSLRFIKYWTNFATTGNPSKESSTSDPYSDVRAWPAFTIPELQYKELAVNLTSGSGIKADECHFWNEYLPQLTTFSADLKEAERQWREEFYTWKYTDMEDWRDAFDKYQAIVNKQ